MDLFSAPGGLLKCTFYHLKSIYKLRGEAGTKGDYSSEGIHIFEQRTETYKLIRLLKSKNA